MTPRYDAIIFDLWGTLIHPGRFSVDVIWCLTGLPYADFIPVWDENRKKRETGPLETAFVELFDRLGMSSSPAVLSRALDAHATLQKEALNRGESSAVAVLRAVRRAGFRIGLVSNCTSDMASCFHESGIGRQVDAAAFSTDLGVMKPNVRMYQHVCDRLGVAPTRCLYVGDGGDDELSGAAAAGMDAVLLETSPRAWPGRRISRLRDVVDIATAVVGML